MVFQNNVLSGAAGSGTTVYTIDQSLRWDSTANVNLIDSSVGAGDTRKKNTFSIWVKRGKLGLLMYLLGYRYDATNYQYMSFDTSNRLEFTDVSGGSVIGKLVTNRVFRDPSAWYNLTFVWDTANAISSERMIIYVNGVRETSFNTATYPSLNVDSGGAGRASSDIRIGTYYAIAGTFFDGYMANIVYIDNGALDASSFGETNDNGIWIPKDVSGLTFGTRGFYIDGRDASDLGDDESGNGNDFVSGLSAHDQMADSPTNNFCTINSVYADVTGANNLTLTEGNLKATGSSSSFSMRGFTFNVPKSGKWYFEYTIGGGYDGFGFCVVGQEATITPSGNGLGQLSVSQGGGIQYQGWRNGGSYTVSMGSAFTSGHIHQVAIDVDNGKFYYGIQNTYYAADAGTDGNPSAGTNHTSTFDFSGNDVVLMTAVSTDSNAEHWNFGQNGTFNGTVTAGGNSDANGIGNFKYSVPTGYLALCTKNLGS